jgi:hypothetical protein
LTKGSDGTTQLHLNQAGFSGSNPQAIEGAKYGWKRMGEELKKVLAKL